MKMAILSITKGTQTISWLSAVILSLIIYDVSAGSSAEGHRDGTAGQVSWHQFRGMNRDGSITDSHADAGRQAKDLTLLWKHEIGSGFSEVVIAGDRIYTLMAEKTDSITGTEYLVCLDAHSGLEKWRIPIDDIYIDEDEWGDGPRSTPVVDDDMIYCFSGSGRLVAISLASISSVWSVDFVEKFGSTTPRWGFAASPLLVDNMLIIEVGGQQEHAFMAFDKYTGAQIWAAGSAAAAYNSPITANIDSTEYIVFVNGSNLYAFDKEGTQLWTFTMPLRSPMALPLFIEPNMIFVSAANDAGSFIIEVVDGQPNQILTSNQIRNDWSSSSYHDGYIYGFNVATLQCMDASNGVRKWLKRGFGKGSLIAVNESLIILSDTGTLSLAKINTEAYLEIASIDVMEGRSWTAPSYSDGKIYVRNHSQIACIQIIY